MGHPVLGPRKGRESCVGGCGVYVGYAIIFLHLLQIYLIILQLSILQAHPWPIFELVGMTGIEYMHS